MNYYLNIGKNKKINLSKINLDKKESVKLKYIDDFTMAFENEEELKESLINKNLIDNKEAAEKMNITYGVKDKRYIPIIYSEDKETIAKIMDLAIEIKKYFDKRKRETHSTYSYNLIMGDYPGIKKNFESFKVFAGNHNFIKSFQTFISSNPNQDLNIRDLSLYKYQFNEDKESIELYVAFYESFRRIFYVYNKEKKELKFNYKGFRDFCVFYCEYKRKLEERKAKKALEKAKEENEVWIQSSVFEAETEMPKTPILKESEDVNNTKWVLSSEGEPDFPPNSEEEANYKKYLEQLEEIADNEPIENHPHYRR